MYYWMIILFHIGIAISFLPIPGVGLFMRILLFPLMIVGLFFITKKMTSIEQKWIKIGLFYLSGTLISALFAFNTSVALVDFVRQLFIWIFSVSLIFILQIRKIRVTFIKAALLPLFIGIIFIIGIYISYSGPSSIDYDSIRVFKLYIFSEYNIALNPISFSILLLLLLTYGYWRKKLYLTVIISIMSLIFLLISGSRTTIISLAIAIVIVFLINLFKRSPLFLKGTSMTIVISFLIYINTFILPHLSIIKDKETLSEITAGRLDLWIAAWLKFLDRPIFGWGAGSWKFNIYEYLPYYYPFGSDVLLSLTSGSFHNAFLTVLAEKGLITFIPGLIMFTLVIRLSFFIYYNQNVLEHIDREFAKVAPIITILITIRSFSEQPGLLGYANSTVDFITYSIVSLIIATSIKVRNVIYGGKK